MLPSGRLGSAVVLIVIPWREANDRYRQAIDALGGRGEELAIVNADDTCRGDAPAAQPRAQSYAQAAGQPTSADLAPFIADARVRALAQTALDHLLASGLVAAYHPVGAPTRWTLWLEAALVPPAGQRMTLAAWARAWLLDASDIPGTPGCPDVTGVGMSGREEGSA